MKKDSSKQPVMNWDWICHDDNLTCWEKFHQFYEPQKLFMKPKFIAAFVNLRKEKTKATITAQVCFGSELNEMKNRAFGVYSS